VKVAPWLLLGVAIVAVAWLVHERERLSDLTSDLTRVAEAEALEAQGQIVEARAERDELEARLAEVSGRSAELAQALERARKAAPTARVVRVTEASTGSVAVQGDPPPGLGSAVIEDGTGAQRPDAQGDSQSPCLLRRGDRGAIWIREATLETAAGNKILVGAAEAWRLEPGPASRLFAGQFESTLTDSRMVSPTASGDGWPTWQVVAVGIGSALVGGLVAAAVVR
jgi:hypothetical protein